MKPQSERSEAARATTLGVLTSRRFRTFCRKWLIPDSFEYRARILREQERTAERMAFYRNNFSSDRKQKGA